MRAFPAMPSPIPAPMAPPPRASPPPMRPPAVATACVMSFAAIVRLSPSRTSCDVWSVLFGGCESEVEDGQEGVDERLDRGDEARVEDAPDEVGEPVEREQVGRKKRDHREHDAAGEDVAEKSQGQRERVDDLLQQQDRAPQRRLDGEPVTDVAPPLLLDAEIRVKDRDGERHCVDEVDVRSRRLKARRVVAGREPAQPVAEQDEEEQADTE